MPDIAANMSISLVWPEAEDELGQTIRDVILDEVRKEAKRHATAIRESVRSALASRQAELIERAVTAALNA